jgi:hypothetical protein
MSRVCRTRVGALMAHSVELCRDTIGKAVLGVVADREASGFG